MDKHLTSVLAVAILATIILSGYFYLRGESEPVEVQHQTGLPSTRHQQKASVPLATREPEQRISRPLNSVETKATVAPSVSWISGTWDDDGFCQGDSGETFDADNFWGTWSEEGWWSLAGDRLTVASLYTVRDTKSGEPEPIEPPKIVVGTIKKVTPDSFDLTVDGEIRHLVRCQSDAEE